MRSLLLVRDLFLERAAEYAKDREYCELAPMKREDAKDMRRLASYVEKEQYIKAFKAWRSLDSLPRDFVARRTINWIARQAIAEHERTHGTQKAKS